MGRRRNWTAVPWFTIEGLFHDSDLNRKLEVGKNQYKGLQWDTKNEAKSDPRGRIYEDNILVETSKCNGIREHRMQNTEVTRAEEKNAHILTSNIRRASSNDL